MGKVSPKEKTSKTSKQKKRNNGSNKYLKEPGALAQLRNSKASSSKSCMDIGKNKVDAMDFKSPNNGTLEKNKCENDNIPIILSPEKFRNNHLAGHKENNLQRTPKTPRPVGNGSDYESRLESLPMDLLFLGNDFVLMVFHFMMTLMINGLILNVYLSHERNQVCKW